MLKVRIPHMKKKRKFFVIFLKIIFFNFFKFLVFLYKIFFYKRGDFK